MKLLLSALLATATLAAPAQTPISVMLVGDSTQTDSAGYGRGFCANLSPQITCLNNAKGGASTKTYRAQGLWDKAVALHPTYMLIQFGHNDEQSSAHADRETDLVTEYPANLRRFVTEARAAGITPVLVTPLSRRYYGTDNKIHSDLTAHSEAMKKVAAELHTPLIDLQTDSIAFLNSITPAQGNSIGITKKNEKGETVFDKTHLNIHGSYIFGRIVAEDLARAVPELKKYVLTTQAVPPAIPEPDQKLLAAAIDSTTASPATIDATNSGAPSSPAPLRAKVGDLHGPIRILLVGDSTTALGGGWGSAFCPLLTAQVTCINHAANGRSSKSFYDEGRWKKALADVKPGATYITIQFGHNDMRGKGPDRETDPATTFPANLQRYVAEARAAGATPILVTPLSRRSYKEGHLVHDLDDYSAAARKAAAEAHVPLVDLNADSSTFLETLTQAQADEFDLIQPGATEDQKKGPDRTHLNDKGKAVFAAIVAADLKKAAPELVPYFKP